MSSLTSRITDTLVILATSQNYQLEEIEKIINSIEFTRFVHQYRSFEWFGDAYTFSFYQLSNYTHPCESAITNCCGSILDDTIFFNLTIGHLAIYFGQYQLLFYFRARFWILYRMFKQVDVNGRNLLHIAASRRDESKRVDWLGSAALSPALFTKCLCETIFDNELGIIGTESFHPIDVITALRAHDKQGKSPIDLAEPEVAVYLTSVLKLNLKEYNRNLSRASVSGSGSGSVSVSL